jgi:pimeloyl-ACP methyl ester carboxylesterase
VAADLEENFEVLAPDQRGHGESRGNVEGGTFSPRDLAADLAETLAAEQFHPAAVIGHSMGVRVALALYHLKPEYVQRLILVDLGVSGHVGAAHVEPLVEFLGKLPVEFPNRVAMRAFLESHAPDPSYVPYLLAVAVRTPSGGLGFPFDPPSLIRIQREAAGAPFEKWLEDAGRAGVPVLVLRGERSNVYTHDAFEAERARFAAYPSIQFEEVPGVGHGLPFENRPGFTKKVSAYLLMTSASFAT